MQIKQQMLAQQVQKKIAPLYVLIGQDNYLLEASLTTIKSAIKKIHNYEERAITIQSAEDWMTVLEAANSYSLFSEVVLLTILFDKKTMDTKGKQMLIQYLKSVNPRCFIIINAPNISVKQLQGLITHEQTVISTIYPLNQMAMKNWIANELKRHTIEFNPQIPNLIYQYTQGNMLACAQVIEKIVLSHGLNSTINMQQVQEQLWDQCHHNLFELVESCLQGQGDKTIQILRHAANTKTEPTLVLWMLTQEIRVIMQFANLLQQQVETNIASAQLKIWPQRISLYQFCCKRLTEKKLRVLHQYCSLIDERIKLGFSSSIWNSIENLALSLCTGELMGDVCTL
jgi:DNA polymerase-3 subunit delta